MKSLVVAIIVLTGGFMNLQAQAFTHQAALKGGKADGFYRLPLYPAAKQYMKQDVSDLRVFDSLNREVAYVLISEPQLRSSTSFVNYPIVSQKHFKNYSDIIIENSGRQAINNIAFNITNSDAHKYCAVEGSDNKTQWYSVSESQELSLAYNDLYTNTYKCIYFPKVDYKYIRLLVEDWNSEPLKINSAGYFKNSVMPGQMEAVPYTLSRKEDSVHKTTHLFLRFVGKQIVNRIDFKISEPTMFRRSARILVRRERVVKHSTESYREVLQEFELNSKESLMLDVNGLNEKELEIEIENKDNQPLKTDSIKCLQLLTWLVCDLKANANYVLKCGNTQLKSPEYDLANFIGNTPFLLPQLNYSEFKVLPVTTTPKINKEKAFYETKSFIWLCIGVGSVVLFLFSRSLMKDMSEENKSKNG